MISGNYKKVLDEKNQIVKKEAAVEKPTLVENDILTMNVIKSEVKE